MTVSTPISEVFGDARFVLLPDGKKAPPIEHEWQHKPHTYEEACFHPGNVAVMYGEGSIGLDLDDVAAFAGVDLPRSTRWQTRPGRAAMRFSCSDVAEVLAARGDKFDRAQFSLVKDGKPVGELKVGNAYQLIPPSWKTTKEEPDKRLPYLLVDEVPPAEISLAVILATLAGVGIAPKGENRMAAAKLKLEEQEQKARKSKAARLADNGFLGDAFPIADIVRPAGEVVAQGDEIQGSHPGHGSDGGKNFCINPSRNTWHCFRCDSGGGPLEWIAVEAGLISCADAKPGCLDGIFPQVLDAAKLRGLAVPDRPAPKITLKSTTGTTTPEAGDAAPKKKGTPGISTTIVRYIVGNPIFALWHTRDMEAFISMKVGDHCEHHKLGSNASRFLLSRIGYELSGYAAGSQAVQDAINALSGIALFDGEEHETFIRLANVGDDIYVDLGTSSHDAVHVSREGWEVVADPPVHFLRPSGLLPMPIPERGGNWLDLRKLINAPTREIWVLAVAWLVQAFWPHGPFCHLVINGEQGSLKTSLMRTLKTLVDPTKGSVRGRPRDAETLLIQSAFSLIVTADNLSGLVDGWLSDSLCGLSTGTAMGKRQLWTPFEEAVLEVKRPVMINGIDVIIPRGDLADRSIFLELPRVEHRRSEAALAAEFAAAWPSLLGLILDATAEGLANLESIELDDPPRMIDFARWVTACEPALPWPAGTFEEVYSEGRADRALDSVMFDPFARAVFQFAVNAQEITPAQFLTAMNYEAKIDQATPPPRGWPVDPTRLSAKIRRISPLLREVGVDIRSRKSNGIRYLSVVRTAPTIPHVSHSSDDGQWSFDADRCRVEAAEKEKDAHFQKKAKEISGGSNQGGPIAAEPEKWPEAARIPLLFAARELKAFTSSALAAKAGRSLDQAEGFLTEAKLKGFAKIEGDRWVWLMYPTPQPSPTGTAEG